MDAFKLAFDTTIAGLLALPWLIVAIDLLFPLSFTRITETFKAHFSEHLETVVAIWLVSIAYCLGSAISPIASQFLDDEHWPLSEHTIRTELYCKEIDLSSTIPKSLVGHYPSADEFKMLHGESFCQPANSISGREASREQRIAALFRLQESKVLSQDSGQTERLRQLNERLIVLRGTVFNGALLWLLLLLGCIAPRCKNFGNGQGVEPHVANAEPDGGDMQQMPQPGSGWIKVRKYILLGGDRVRGFMRSQRIVGGVAIAVYLIVFFTYSGFRDIVAGDITDEPIMECALLSATVIGLHSVLVGVPPRKYLDVRLWLVVSLITALAYGGWVWTEIIYVREVISSFSAL